MLICSLSKLNENAATARITAGGSLLVFLVLDANVED